MPKIFVLIASLLLGASAHAATYSYDYQGLTLQGETCEPTCDEAFAGSLWIDEALVPGGTIAGATLNFYYHHRPTAPEYYPGHFTFVSDVIAIWSNVDKGNLPDFIRMDGVFSEALFGIVADYGEVEFTFDDNRQMESWRTSGLYGGSNDFSVSSSGDFVADGREAGPGTWTMTAHDTAPAPVPLPAAGLLLVGAVGALGLERKLKSKT